MSTNDKELDLSLLDMEMDSIDDLPGFEVPPNGEYLLQLTSVVKAINGAIYVETSYEVLECLAQDDDSDQAAKVGNKFSSLFCIKGDGKDKEKDLDRVAKGLGYLKQLLADIAESSGQGNLLVLIRDVVANCTVQATVKRRQDKEDKEKFYASVKNLKLA